MNEHTLNKCDSTNKSAETIGLASAAAVESVAAAVAAAATSADRLIRSHKRR